ncbi:hypothetical protein PENTCL1PPCAC_27108, partial [Pristionchus entomophagus]
DGRSTGDFFWSRSCGGKSNPSFNRLNLLSLMVKEEKGLAGPPPVGELSCDKCNITCETHRKLVVHSFSHKIPTPATHPTGGEHGCDLCPRSFSTSHGLKLHKRTHTAKRRHTEEEEEGEEYRPSRSKRRAPCVSTPTHAASFSHKCDVCQRAFETFKGLRKHQRVH